MTDRGRASTGQTVAPPTDRGRVAVRRSQPRWREFWLLTAALVVAASGWWGVDQHVAGHMTASAGLYLLGYSTLWLGVHLLLCWIAPGTDEVMVPCCALLNGLGLVMIHRIDLAQRAHLGSDASANAPQQLLWTLMALLVFAAVLIIVRDHRPLARYGYTAGLVGLVLIAVPAVLPARISEVNGAKLWIRVSGFSVQPGELAKVALTIFFAAYLVNKRELLASAGRRILRCDIPRGRDLGPLLVVWTLSVLVLVTQKDLGMALLLFTVFLTCLYISTARMGWLVIGTALLVVVVVGAYYTLPHVHTRIAVWLDPFAYPDSGYQMQQSLFSFGTGGILGTGLGAGHPDLVPLARTDFIVAAFGEETGLFGITAIILCYVLVVSRGLRIAQLTRDSFGQLLAAGLTFTLGFQVFIIIAGISNLLPETGLATPLLSYGGSSLLANLAAIAVLLRISDRAYQAPWSAPPRGSAAPPAATTRDLRRNEP